MESFQVHTFYRPFTLLEWINCKEKHSQLKSLGLCNFMWINISCQKISTDTFSFTAYKGGEIIISISLSMQLQYWFSCFLPKYCSNLLWSNISSEKMDYINQQVFPVWDLHWKYWLTQKLWKSWGWGAVCLKRAESNMTQNTFMFPSGSKWHTFAHYFFLHMSAENCQQIWQYAESLNLAPNIVQLWRKISNIYS